MSFPNFVKLCDTFLEVELLVQRLCPLYEIGVATCLSSDAVPVSIPTSRVVGLTIIVYLFI